MPEQTDQPTTPPVTRITQARDADLQLKLPTIRVYLFCLDRLQQVPAGIVILSISEIDDGVRKRLFGVKRRIYLDRRPDHVEAGLLTPEAPAERTCSADFYQNEDGQELTKVYADQFFRERSELHTLREKLAEIEPVEKAKTRVLEELIGHMNNMIGAVEALSEGTTLGQAKHHHAGNLRAHLILARDRARQALGYLSEEEIKATYAQQLDGEFLPRESPSLASASDDYKDAERDAKHLLHFPTSPLGGSEVAKNIARCFLHLMRREHDRRVYMAEPTEARENLRIEQLVNERDRWLYTALGLWGLLDDIDTLDDAAKSDDAGFRKRCYEIQRRRFQHIDGVELDKIIAQPGIPEELRARFGDKPTPAPEPVPWGASFYLTTPTDQRGQIVGPYPGTPTLADLRRLVDAMRSNRHPIDLVEPGGYMGVYVTREQADALWDDNEVKRLIERCSIPSNMTLAEQTYGLLVGARLVRAPEDIPF